MDDGIDLFDGFGWQRSLGMKPEREGENQKEKGAHAS